jgi:transposase
MQVLHERCAGIDVHKKNVVVTVLLTDAGGVVTKHVQTFSTMTDDLLRLDAWLAQLDVTEVAMESTGVYWYPIYNLLEEGRSITLVNAQHMKAVPGRKTDVKDSEWIADLLRHGLLKPSFIPPQPIRALRELTRYRKTLIQERAQEANRLQKVLEGANIKLAAVATDMLGTSAREMLLLLVEGEHDLDAIAQRARARMRPKIPELRRALQGHMQPQQRVVIQRILAHVDFLDDSIRLLQQEIDAHLKPYQEAMQLLQTIPGIKATAAAVIISEIGTDMHRFPSAKHLASWAGLCPGNKQSGGKRYPEGITKGNPWLRAVLGEVVWSISHTHNNYLGAQYRRLAKRRGAHKAVVAVAHSVLVIIYHVLSEQQPYRDLGSDYFDKLDNAHQERHFVRCLEQLGYSVRLTPAVA